MTQAGRENLSFWPFSYNYHHEWKRFSAFSSWNSSQQGFLIPILWTPVTRVSFQNLEFICVSSLLASLSCALSALAVGSPYSLFGAIHIWNTIFLVIKDENIFLVSVLVLKEAMFLGATTLSKDVLWPLVRYVLLLRS